MLIDLFLAVGCIVYVWRRTNCRFYPSPQFILIAVYFLYYYLGLIISYREPWVNESEYFSDLVWMIRAGFLAIFAASVLTRNWRTLRFDYYRDRFFDKARSDDAWLSKHLYPLWIVMAFVIFIYLLLIPVQPIQVMFTNPAGMVEARELVTVGFDNYGFFSNFFEHFVPITWLLLLLYGRRVAGTTLLLLNLFVLLSTGQKSPVVYVLFLYALLIGFMRGKIAYKQNIQLGLLAAFILVAMVYYQNAHLLGSLNWEAISLSAEGLIRRIFFVGPQTVLGFLSTFPDAHPFLLGANTDIPADKIVYQAVIGLDVDGTMNSNSLAFFYAWFGNRYIALAMYFFIIMFFFITPWLLTKLSFPRNLAITGFLLFNLLLVRFNITDWYTIYFIFILSLLVVNGLLLITKFLLNLPVGPIVYRASVFSAVTSVLTFLYFFQGQLRSLIS